MTTFDGMYMLPLTPEIHSFSPGPMRTKLRLFSCAVAICAVVPGKAGAQQLGPEPHALSQAAVQPLFPAHPLFARESTLETAAFGSVVLTPALALEERTRPWWLWPGIGAVAGGVLGWHLFVNWKGSVTTMDHVRGSLYGAGYGAAAGFGIEAVLRAFGR